MDREPTSSGVDSITTGSMISSDSQSLYNALEEVQTPKALQRSIGPSAFKQHLSPSPSFREPAARPGSDGTHIENPTKSVTRGPGSLFLQMPKDEAGNITIDSYSPHADNKDIYGSPNTVLPRRSRGMDFARACTNLHHSTLPNVATPDSSPVFTQKSMKIPSRRSSAVSSMWESPRPMGLYAMPIGGSNERFRPRSIGSTTAMMSDGSDSSSDEDEKDESEEMVMTPHVQRQQGDNMFTPYGLRDSIGSGGGSHLSSPVDRRFHPFRRNTTARGSGRLQIPRRMGVQKPVDDSPSTDDVGEDGSNESPLDSESAVSKNALRIKTEGDSGDEITQKIAPSTPGVVRRPVVRRSNLLPKTKGFARIRAALQEESVPIDTDFKREAEVVRQVRAKEPGPLSRGISTTSSSPDLTPSTSSIPQEASDMSDADALSGSLPTDLPNPMAFNERRGSTNRELWPHLYSRMETPPPPSSARPRSSSGASEDMRLDSPAISVSKGLLSAMDSTADHKSGSETETRPFHAPNMPSAADITRKITKRRRDEDFDPISMKRRAVSPGMSVASSPIRGQSPVSTAGGWMWGQPKSLRQDSGGSTAEGRSGSTSSVGLTTPAQGPMTPSSGTRRIGTAAQTGMFDTNDGLTRMTLD